MYPGGTGDGGMEPLMTPPSAVPPRRFARLGKSWQSRFETKQRERQANEAGPKVEEQENANHRHERWRLREGREWQR